MEYDYKELRGRIIAKFGKIETFANVLDVSYAWVSKKLNGKSLFSQKDIETWRSLLGIGVNEIGFYFFTQKVQQD